MIPPVFIHEGSTIEDGILWSRLVVKNRFIDFELEIPKPPYRDHRDPDYDYSIVEVQFQYNDHEIQFSYDSNEGIFCVLVDIEGDFTSPKDQERYEVQCRTAFEIKSLDNLDDLINQEIYDEIEAICCKCY